MKLAGLKGLPDIKNQICIYIYVYIYIIYWLSLKNGLLLPMNIERPMLYDTSLPNSKNHPGNWKRKRHLNQNPGKFIWKKTFNEVIWTKLPFLSSMWIFSRGVSCPRPAIITIIHDTTVMTSYLRHGHGCFRKFQHCKGIRRCQNSRHIRHGLKVGGKAISDGGCKGILFKNRSRYIAVVGN